jgi:hypothetical protein
VGPTNPDGTADIADIPRGMFVRAIAETSETRTQPDTTTLVAVSS